MYMVYMRVSMYEPSLALFFSIYLLENRPKTKLWEEWVHLDKFLAEGAKNTNYEYTWWINTEICGCRAQAQTETENEVDGGH